MAIWDDAWSAAKKLPGIRVANDVINPSFGASDATKENLQGDAAANRQLSSTFLNAYNNAGRAGAPTMGAASVGNIERANGATVGATRVGAAPTITAAQQGPAAMVDRTIVGPAAQAQGVQMGPVAQQGRTAVGPASTLDPNGYRLGPAQIGGAAFTGPAKQAAAARIDTGRSDQFRGDQLGLVQNLKDVVAGKAPSVAQEMLHQATDDTIANARGNAVAASRGGNTALAMREMQRAQAGATQQAAGQGALLRANEITAARGQMGDVLSGARGQDIGIEVQNAGFQQQSALQNAAQANQLAQTNAQLGTTANLQNASMLNQQGLQDAQLRLAASQGNQQAQNAVNTQQAALDAQQASGNADRLNARDTTQAQMDLQNRQFNAGVQNTTAAQQAAINAAAAQQNAVAQNTVAGNNAGYQQQAGVQNAANQLAIVQQAANLEAARNQQQAAIDAGTGQFNATAQNAANTQNATFQQQANANNQGAAVTTNAQNIQDRTSSGDLALGAQRSTDLSDIDTAKLEAKNQADENAWAGGIVNQMSSAMTGGAKPPTSDRRAKQNVKPEDDRQFASLFAAIKPSSYEYRDPGPPGSGTAPGRRHGVMAQDLERGGPIGKSLVFDDGGTKKLDAPQAIGVVMAMGKHLNDRLRRLEGRR